MLLRLLVLDFLAHLFLLFHNMPSFHLHHMHIYVLCIFRFLYCDLQFLLYSLPRIFYQLSFLLLHHAKPDHLDYFFLSMLASVLLLTRCCFLLYMLPYIHLLSVYLLLHLLFLVPLLLGHLFVILL